MYKKGLKYKHKKHLYLSEDLSIFNVVPMKDRLALAGQRNFTKRYTGFLSDKNEWNGMQFITM